MKQTEGKMRKRPARETFLEISLSPVNIYKHAVRDAGFPNLNLLRRATVQTITKPGTRCLPHRRVGCPYAQTKRKKKEREKRSTAIKSRFYAPHHTNAGW